MDFTWEVKKKSGYNGILLRNKKQQTTGRCNNIGESQMHYAK